MPILGGQVPVEQGSDDVPHAADVVQTGLPRGTDLVAVLFAGVVAKLSSEGIVAPEVAQQLGVVALHDDRRGDDCRIGA